MSRCCFAALSSFRPARPSECTGGAPPSCLRLALARAVVALVTMVPQPFQVLAFRGGVGAGACPCVPCTNRRRGPSPRSPAFPLKHALPDMSNSSSRATTRSGPIGSWRISPRESTGILTGTTRTPSTASWRPTGLAPDRPTAPLSPGTETSGSRRARPLLLETCLLPDAGAAEPLIRL